MTGTGREGTATAKEQHLIHRVVGGAAPRGDPVRSLHTLSVGPHSHHRGVEGYRQLKGSDVVVSGVDANGNLNAVAYGQGPERRSDRAAHIHVKHRGF